MDNEEWEEETICIELSGLIDNTMSSFKGKKCKLIGIDSEEPILQVGEHIFQGSLEHCLGTKLIFDPSIDNEEDEDCANKITLTTKVLKMHKIFVEEKGGDMKKDLSDKNIDKETDMEVIEES